MRVSAEERQRIFQEAWDKGDGFRFMFETFSDITTSEESNEAAASLYSWEDRGDSHGSEVKEKVDSP